MERAITKLNRFSILSSETVNIPNLTLYQVLEQSVSRWPNNVAISYFGTQWTYSELKDQVDTFASALQGIGIQKGDRVGLMLPNCPEYVVSYFGILAVGGIVVQINPMYTERELTYMISNSGAETIIAADSNSATIDAIKYETNLKHRILVQIEASDDESLKEEQSYKNFMKNATGHFTPAILNPFEDVAIIQYTGGTTGRSKGAMLTHRNLVSSIIQNDEVLKSSLHPGTERILTVIPLFHVYGMTLCMNSGIFRGACLILLPRFKKEEVLEVIKNEKPTYFPGVPTMYIALNSHPEVEKFGINSIKVCHSGGSSMPLELIQEFEQKIGTKIIEAYGLSETSPGAIGQTLTGMRKQGSVGIPLPSTEAKIVDLKNPEKIVPRGEVGELVIKGPQVMKGYWKMPDETAETLKDGWIYTGDIAKMDKDGHVFIVDRKKDLIIASGYNVYPREIEEVLYEHPAVLEAVVFGVSDEYRGETVKAVVVLKQDFQITEEELSQFCRKNLSVYKAPKLFEIRSEIPKSSVGKILRRTLREEQMKLTLSY